MPTLGQLFWTFLKIGAASFGGFMALVAVVRKQVVEGKKWVSDDVVVEGITLGSMMPGPLAVNVVSYLGYRMRGWAGAFVSMGAVLLPTFVLVWILSWLYFSFRSLPLLEQLFRGILPAVLAVILSVVWDMGQKKLKDPRQYLIGLGAFLCLILLRGFWVTLALIVLGGLIGWLWQRNNQTKAAPGHKHPPLRSALLNDLRQITFYGLLPLATLALLLSLPGWLGWGNGLAFAEGRNLLLTFSGMSVSLFGGGYVFIPAMQEVVVGEWGWLTAQEFTDGIAMGQITPGPIMISAAFVGYKVWGFWGALLATVGMFLPPACLMVFCGRYFDLLRERPAIQQAFWGITPAVIGMIAASVVVIGRSMQWDSMVVGILLLTLVLAIWRKWSPLYLIPLGGALSLGLSWIT